MVANLNCHDVGAFLQKTGANPLRCRRDKGLTGLAGVARIGFLSNAYFQLGLKTFVLLISTFAFVPGWSPLMEWGF